MNPVIFEAAGWTLVHFLWQGLAIGAIYGIYLGAFRTRPQARYLGGCLALILMVGAVAKTYHFQFLSLKREAQAEPPKAAVTYEHAIITFSQCRSCHTVVDGPASETPEAEIPPLDHLEGGFFSKASSPFLSWGIAIWLIGVTLLFLRLAISHTTIQRLRRSHSGPPNPSVTSSLKKISDQLGVRTSVQIVMSKAITIPIVIGCSRPVILLPVHSIAGLSRFQLNAILAHELAHVRRHDYLVNLLQHVLEIVFFFHPAVWFVSSAIRKEREFCCDDIALTTSRNVIDYARALTTLEELRIDRPALGMAANGGTLLARIKRLGGDDKPRSNSLLLGSAVVLMTALSVPLTILPIHARALKNEAPAERVEILPLPSGEAEKGLRQLLGKTPESNIPYEDFTNLARSLNDSTLLSMIAEIGLEKEKGYLAWTLKALVAERNHRNVTGLPSPQKMNQFIIVGCPPATTSLITPLNSIEE